MDRSILLVDGDANFRRALAIGLRLEGIRVAEAAEAGAARELLEGGAGYDLVLVDLLLPRGGALALVELLRRRHPATRTILACARPEAFSAVERIAGVVQLEKPFAPERLLAFLAEGGAGAGAEAPSGPAPVVAAGRNGSGRRSTPR